MPISLYDPALKRSAIVTICYSLFIYSGKITGFGL